MASKPKQIGPLGSTARVRMMFAAKSGFGKTVFCGTAPRCLFLTTDPEGTISAKRRGSKAEEWKIRNWLELEEAYVWLRDGGHEEYDWVIVDNITEAQRMAMQQSIDVELKKRPGRDPLVPETADYQRNQNAIIQMVLKFNDLPLNIIYTSHRKGMEDGDGNDYYSVAIHGQQGQVAEQILGYMNLVAFGDIVEKDGNERRRYYFSHTGPQRGKDRFDVLGKFKDELTVPRMMEIIAGVSGTTARPAAKKTAAARRRRTTTA